MYNPFAIVPRLLRHPAAFFESVGRGERIVFKIVALAISTVTFLAAYGFATGLSHSLEQALSTSVKMPALFLVTALFCLPAFYFFSLVLGTRLQMAQVTTVVLAGLSVTALLLLGLSPITLFFVLTSTNYAFFRIMAAAFVGLTGLIGMHLLWRGITFIDTQGGDPALRLRRPLLGLWFGLFAFMGTQLTWRLSPFVGDPAQPFVLIGPSRDNFYVDVLNALSELTGVAFSPGASLFLAAAICLVPLLFMLFGLGLMADPRPPQPAPRDPAPQAPAAPGVSR